MTKIKPLICGVSGPAISAEEKNFLVEVNPVGFVLFRKNIKNKEQALNLTNSLRELFKDRSVPILIDQEGGNVLRLKEKCWRQPPSPLELGKFAYISKEDALEKTKRLVYLNALLIGYEMKEIGVNVNCAPVADLLISGAHHITSTRSFGPDKLITAELVKEMARGLLDSGVVPIVKHMMGQGRAKCDSHIELPIVKESLDILESNDFKVFADARNIPWGMPAHIIYHALDPDNIVTYSKRTIDYIREKLEFKGILISDCLTMKALPDGWGEKSRKAYEAGLDLILYGSCKLEIIDEIAKNIGYVTDNNWQRIEKSLNTHPIENIKFDIIKDEFDQLFLNLEDNLKNSLVSEDLELILETISSRKKINADFSCPLYNV